MNKKILSASAVATVLAAMPLLGVFAVESDTVVDKITITVPESCNLEVDNGEGKDIKETMAVGTVKTDIEGSKFSIACNTEGTWSLTAQGTGASNANALNPAGEGTAIQSSADPAANLKVNTTTSDWGFKLTTGGAAAVESGYDSWKQIPSTSTKIASGSAVDGTDTVDVTYGVAIANDQEADTYTGQVTYTLTQP